MIRSWLVAVLVFACGCSARAAAAGLERNCAEIDPSQFQRPSSERITAARAALRAGSGLVGEFTVLDRSNAPTCRTQKAEQEPGSQSQQRARGAPDTATPAGARERGAAGGVRVDGSVEEISVLESSGWIVVDRIAVDALQEARFRPANLNGCSVPSWFALPLTLALD